MTKENNQTEVKNQVGREDETNRLTNHFRKHKVTYGIVLSVGLTAFTFGKMKGVYNTNLSHIKETYEKQLENVKEQSYNLGVKSAWDEIKVNKGLGYIKFEETIDVYDRKIPMSESMMIALFDRAHYEIREEDA